MEVPKPLLENEAKYKAFVLKMTFILMQMNSFYEKGLSLGTVLIVNGGWNSKGLLPLRSCFDIRTMAVFMPDFNF